MPTIASPRLNSEQVETYRREGYLIYPEAIFPQEKFDRLKDHFEQKLAVLPADVRPESMDVPHFTDTKLFEWLLSDEVLDLVEPIIGPDIALFSSHFICKPKGNGKKVPWHEDSFYWRGMMEPMEVVTVWLAIDPSKKENGAMQVIPRTLHGYSEYDPVDPNANVFPTEIKKHMRDDSKAVTLELDPNHASLHDGRLMHGSPPNTSTLRRCGYTMRYIPTNVKLSEKASQYHQFYLARGKDRAGNTYADPTKSYPHLARYRETHGKNGH
ncbi:MAG TPA: phytanoyl-CoA dioxygenase family protein [Tepidisphaeraceae bacterium]|nr:phytanoyl-CoA dioxygenase family protein [Tepidisphaeraceae bacterium]